MFCFVFLQKSVNEREKNRQAKKAIEEELLVSEKKNDIKYENVKIHSYDLHNEFMHQ